MSGDRGLNNMSGTQISAHAFDDESEDDLKDNDSDGDQFFEFNLEKASRELAKLICIGVMPPSIIGCPIFRDFMLAVNPNAQFGNFETVKDNALKLYKVEEQKVKHIFKNLEARISISVETLRSPSFNEYMCLTANFIDDSWKHKKWVLKFGILSKDILPVAIQKALKHWDIEDKISTITLKSDTFINDVVDSIKEEIEKKRQLQLNGKLFHVHCCGDLFNLMAQAAFDAIPEIIIEVSWLISPLKSLPLWYLKNSWLEDALELNSIGEFSSLPQNEVPSDDEWKKLEFVCKLVDKLHNVAKGLFKAKDQAASVFLPTLLELKASLNMGMASSSSDSFMGSVFEKMISKLDKYCKDMFVVLAIATIMDPRYKVTYIEFLLKKFEDNDDLNSRISSLMEAIHSIYKDYPTDFLAKDESMVDSNSSESEEEDPQFSNKNRSNPNEKNLDIVQIYNEFIQSTNRSSKSELDLYLEEPVVEFGQDFNTLDWWKRLSPKFPNLSRMARDFLAIRFSILTSYDAYYYEERMIERELVSLGPGMMNAVMCTRSWNPKKH